MLSILPGSDLDFGGFTFFDNLDFDGGEEATWPTTVLFRTLYTRRMCSWRLDVHPSEHM